jgi:hypothetical protein
MSHHVVLPDSYYTQLRDLQAVDFVLVELMLYLDTHPNFMKRSFNIPKRLVNAIQEWLACFMSSMEVRMVNSLQHSDT